LLVFVKALAFGNFGSQYFYESQIFGKQLGELPYLQYPSSVSGSTEVEIDYYGFCGWTTSQLVDHIDGQDVKDWTRSNGGPGTHKSYKLNKNSNHFSKQLISFALCTVFNCNRQTIPPFSSKGPGLVCLVLA
jgi:hypothetical protein